MTKMLQKLDTKVLSKRYQSVLNERSEAYSMGIHEYNQECNCMPEIINGDTYYRTSEVCKIVGISRNTLFRWLKEGSVTEFEHRDYRGWRLFTQAQIDALKKKTGQINTIYLGKQAKETSTSKPSIGR